MGCPGAKWMIRGRGRGLCILSEYITKMELLNDNKQVLGLYILP
jgi:hypothetical protein